MVCPIWTASYTPQEKSQEMTEPKPRILYYDIEWKPTSAYVWRMYDENISPDQIIEHGGLLCFSAIWEGEKEVIFHSEWGDGHDEMVKRLHDLFMEADMLVTYNGDKYDIPKSIGEFLLAGLPAPPPVTSVDLLKAVKKMGFAMNRLAFIGPLLGVGGKVKHEGFNLWKSVMEGDESAQKRMEKYCKQDSKLLVTLYKKIRPYIRNHPFVGARTTCGACEGHVLHSRGYRRTKTMKIQRLQCQTCGSWQDGKKEKMT